MLASSVAPSLQAASRPGPLRRSRARAGASVVAAASEPLRFTPAVVRENKSAAGDGSFRLLVLSIEDKARATAPHYRHATIQM